MHIYYFDTDILKNIPETDQCSTYCDAVRQICSCNKHIVSVKNIHSFKINQISAFETDSTGSCFFLFEIDRRYDIISDIEVFVDGLTTKITGNLLKLMANRVCISNENEKIPPILTMCTMFTNLKLKISLGPVPSNFRVVYTGYILDTTTRQLWLNRDVWCHGMLYSGGEMSAKASATSLT